MDVATRKLKYEGFYEEYCQILEERVKEGIVEEVPNVEEDNQGYYLPYRHILKENSTTPLKPVFDASFQGKDSPSLNQCLEVGPNLVELIPKILLRFCEKIGVITDI